METGVHQDRAGGWMLEQEGADRASQPIALWDANPERAPCRAATLLGEEPCGRRQGIAAEDRTQPHCRLGRSCAERQ